MYRIKESFYLCVSVDQQFLYVAKFLTCCVTSVVRKVHRWKCAVMTVIIIMNMYMVMQNVNVLFILIMQLPG